MQTVLIVLALFLVFLSFKIALPLALGLAVVIFALVEGSLPIEIVWQSFFTSYDSFTLLAIPFFMLAGDLISAGGISKRLVRLATAYLGHLTGSLAIITVVCCMFFAAISGSAPATVATIGAIMIPAMIEEKYGESFSTSLVACSGALGPIIPPSILFIVFGTITQESVSKLFMAGVGPGLLIGIVLCAFVYVVSKRNHFGMKREKASKEEKKAALKDAIWALFVPVIILGSIYLGIATPTEAAIVGCVYALIIGIFVYKELDWKTIPEIFTTTGCTTGYCLISLGAAAAFAKLLSMNNIPTLLADWIMSITDSRVVVLLMINLILLIAGCFIEPIPSMTIFAPLMMPLATRVGVDPIHFGCIMVLNLTIGMCTPPVGTNIFVASGIANIPVHRMFKWLLPCLVCMLISLMIVTFVPVLSTGLSSLVK